MWALQSAQGPNIAGRDPVTGEIVPLFHPIKDQWRDHFEWNGPDLIGRTTVGRVTIHVLGINDLIRRDVRAALLREGSFDWDSLSGRARGNPMATRFRYPIERTGAEGFTGRERRRCGPGPGP